MEKPTGAAAVGVEVDLRAVTCDKRLLRDDDTQTLMKFFPFPCASPSARLFQLNAALASLSLPS